MPRNDGHTPEPTKAVKRREQRTLYLMRVWRERQREAREQSGKRAA